MRNDDLFLIGAVVGAFLAKKAADYLINTAYLRVEKSATKTILVVGRRDGRAEVPRAFYN